MEKIRKKVRFNASEVSERALAVEVARIEQEIKE
jgi:hypothetical protein